MASSFEKFFAGRWIAGSTIDDAIREAKRLNGHGLRVILNYLGEEYRSKDMVEGVVQTYQKLIKDTNRNGLKADISLKITELGDLINKKFVYDNYSRIVDLAAKNEVFVWLDMEEYRFVTETINMYRSKMKKGNTGICIQSYLKRSLNDLKHLPPSATVRLVKGAYSGPSNIAYRGRGDTTENYYLLMEYMFSHFRRFTIGTHDSQIIEKARVINHDYKRDVTYAMLKGIRNDYALRLARSGEKVSIYVPFGSDWERYAYRRLKEMSNLKLVIRSLFGG